MRLLQLPGVQELLGEWSLALSPCVHTSKFGLRIIFSYENCVELDED